MQENFIDQRVLMCGTGNEVSQFDQVILSNILIVKIHLLMTISQQNQ